MGSWSAIVGPAKSNKSGYAWRVAQALATRGFRTGGYVQREVRDPEGETLGWDVERVLDEQRVTLARPSNDPDICGYRFQSAGFSAAADWLGTPNRDLVVMDGIGKLEAAGRGHWPAAKRVVEDPTAPHALLCIRDDCLRTIALALPDPLAFLEVPASERDTAAFVEVLDELLRARAAG